MCEMVDSITINLMALAGKGACLHRKYVLHGYTRVYILAANTATVDINSMAVLAVVVTIAKIHLKPSWGVLLIQ